MKLLIETVEDIQVITEAREDGKKNMFIEGIFLVSEKGNRNGRYYPEHIMDKEVARYTKEAIESGRGYGELGHPAGPAINLDKVSHMITQLRKEGTNYIGKALVGDTPNGQIVQKLLEMGANLGVSSRGLGTLQKGRDGLMEVKDDFRLATAADIVADPSAPGAYVKGIMEETDWWFNLATQSWEATKQIEEDIKTVNTVSKTVLAEQKLAMFQRFVNSLVQK